MQIKIERAKPDETEQVLSVLREAANWLEETGGAPWVNDELKPEFISESVEGGMFWFAKVGGEIAGCVRFQLEDKEFWDDIPHADSAFIHRLAVRRKFSGGAVSRALID